MIHTTWMNYRLSGQIGVSVSQFSTAGHYTCKEKVLLLYWMRGDIHV